MPARWAVAGILDPFFETGSEGVVWSVMDGSLPGYDALHILSEGDRVAAYSDDGTMLWDVTVSLEFKRGFRPYPRNPSLGQQAYETGTGAAFWVNGFQADLEPETWAKPFFDRVRAMAWTTRPGKHLFETIREAGREAQAAAERLGDAGLIAQDAAWSALCLMRSHGGSIAPAARLVGLDPHEAEDWLEHRWTGIDGRKSPTAPSDAGRCVLALSLLAEAVLMEGDRAKNITEAAESGAAHADRLHEAYAAALAARPAYLKG